MDGVLPFYQVDAATWCFLSFLLIVTVFFRFSRFWSLRNLDLALLLSISPGLLYVRIGNPMGYVWLFAVSGVLLVRLFSDGYFRRRPRVEQNLNTYGLVFLCIVTFIFLMVKVANVSVDAGTAQTVNRMSQIVHRQDHSKNQLQKEKKSDSEISAPTNNYDFLQTAAKVLTILSHLAVVLGLFWMGRYHFNDPHSGVAMATLYLLIPGTAYDVTKVNHVLPAALVLWAFVAHQKPVVAGGLMGFACGTLFFPIFLIPLWMTYYGRKGALKFGAALAVVGVVLAGSLMLTSIDAHAFRQQLGGAIDWSIVSFNNDVANGFWTTHEAAYRIPVFVSFLLMLVVLVIFPRKKNLEHLIAHSTAIVVGTQFWYPQAGGVYLLWYLPLILLVVFRPHLHQAAKKKKIDLAVSINNANASNGKKTEPATTTSPVNSLFR